ncbi:MAG TPA: Na+/H+ antiporter [Gemmatimonadales bacterium]|jgi:CPA1 family monovalent cation:H+ antiporter|nr:Na+/H+ antiporter [Gemmatimonadales bacterium]
MIPQLNPVELVALLFVAVIGVSLLARRLMVPYPILLVIGGLALALIPGLPAVRLDPAIVFFVFLPPILWAAAYVTSFRDFRANLRPIGFLAIGLVLATTATVAMLVHALIPGISWAAAAALGAIVSPPDAVAAVAILRQLRIPHRVLVVLEGESLVNDATALVLYRTAVAAMVTGSFSLGAAAQDFVFAAVGGLGIGLVVGGLSGFALRWSKDSLADIAITLLAPYVAWSLSERAHTSAVLACVAGGLMVRRFFSHAVSPATRLQATAVWGLLVFALNGVIFILIGLQLRTLAQSVRPGELTALVWQGILVSAVAILTRIIWVPIATWLPRQIPSIRARDPMPPLQVIALVCWASMRGIVTLAAALALPLTTADGAKLPFREQIIILAFIVILVTLVVQGLSLGPLVRWLRLPDDRTLELEEIQARDRAVRAALQRISEIESRVGGPDEQLADLRRHYEDRARAIADRQAGVPPSSSLAEAAFKRARHETLNEERRVLILLRDRGEISDEVLIELERELDLEASTNGLANLQAPLGTTSLGSRVGGRR